MTTVSSDSAGSAGAGHVAFGSALSVNEFAALSRIGVSPIKAVMGCDLESVYVNLPVPVAPPMPAKPRIYGQQNSPPRYEGDVMALERLDGLVYQSRERALENLRREASALGANVVIGVRHVPSPAANGTWTEITAKRRAGHHRMLRYGTTLDFQLLGTAVRDPAMPVGVPRLTTASATEFCKLRAAGWIPTGIAAGCSHKFGANVFAGVTATEIIGSTALWADARADAFSEAKAQMAALAGQGMVGLDVSEDHATYGQAGDPTRSTTWLRALLVKVSMIATVIERSVAPASLEPPMRIMTLR